MGAVYKAFDENLGIYVAVKENLYLSEEFSRQFQREASVLAGLRHPNLPRVSDYFIIPNQGQYIVMDYIGGEDLRQRIEREGDLPEKDVILIGADICDALSYLHSRTPPLIHRDIKPGNIKITSNREIILVDFGLVKVVQGKQQTITGARAMTPGYSPPEQYGTARTDARTDIYSLGATLYASLSGVIPEDSFERVTNKANLTPLARVKPGVKKKLAAVIEKSLETEALKRYQSAGDFKDALLAAGELTIHFQEKLRISPPPAENDESSVPLDQEEYLKNLAVAGSIEKPTGVSMLAGGLRRYSPIAALVVLFAALLFLVLFPKYLPDRIDRLFSGQSQETVPADMTPAASVAEPQAAPSTSTPEPVGAQETPGADTVLPLPSATPFGSSASKIAFTSNRTGTYQVWVMNADGSGQRQLTSLSEGACQPVWSPDGSRVIFISPCSGKQDRYPGANIYIIDIDGSGIKPLLGQASPQGDYDPAWSPDGRRVAFTSLRVNNIPHVFIYHFEDNSLLDISTSKYGDKQPAWAPSGLQLVFVRLAANSQIWISAVDGKSQIIFSPTGPVVNQKPVWSPNGQQILYSQMSVDGTVPYLVGVDYENRTRGPEYRIPAAGQPDSAPVFHVSISPDGARMVFESWPDGVNHDIYISTINGANRKRLTTDRAMDFDPAWQPDPSQ
jgi:serine/threonine protein kinase